MSGQRTLTLLSGQSMTGLTFRMETAGVISGKIVDMDGDPLAAVSVTAMTLDDGPVATRYAAPGIAMTNDLGEYRISDLQPAKYLISALPSQPAPVVHADEKGKPTERLVYASTFYPGTVDRSRAVAVTVRAGQDATVNFGVLMTHAYRVSGTVSGVPSEGIARFMLTSKSGVAGPDGPEELTQGNRFEYQNVLPGSYVAMMIVLKGMGNGGQPDMQMVRLTPPIEVDSADAVGVQPQPESVGQIHGKFRLDTEEQFDWTQLNVNLLPITENESQSAPMEAGYIRATSNAVVNKDGSFEIKNVPGGNYQLVVGAHSDSLRDYYTKSVNFGGRNVADSGFEMNGDVYLDVVVSAKGAMIDGAVVDSKSQPVPYAVVAVVPNSEHRARPDSYQQETTDEHGHFIARGLNAGRFVVLAFDELQEDMRQPDFLKKNRSKGEKVELEEGARKSVTTRIIQAESEAP